MNKKNDSQAKQINCDIVEENEIIKDFKELTTEELINGYVKNENQYSCIFCGKTFEEGIIYKNFGKLMTAEKATLEHVKQYHDGTFEGLINLDKQICGLTDIQKNMLINMYEQNDNKVICENMGISTTTVRAHKFNLQKAKREAKILLALIEIVENEKVLERVKPETTEKLRSDEDDSSSSVHNHSANLLEDNEAEEDSFTLNSLHPFFTQFRYR